MRLAVPAVVLLSVASLAGCSAPLASEVEAPTAPFEPPPCFPAKKDWNGTAVGDYYIDGDAVWQESNGIKNLQTVASCEGERDTLVAG